MGAGESDICYCNLTEEEIIYQMQGQNEEVGNGNDNKEDSDNVSKPPLSKVWEKFYELIIFFDTHKDFQKYYLFIKEVGQEVIKRQYNSLKTIRA